MATINFKCRCPCEKCRSEEGPIIQWKCSYCNSNQLLEDTGKIICSGCGKKEYYIWNARFKCNNSNGTYNKISLDGILVFISEIGTSNAPPIGFIKKITKQILINEKAFEDEYYLSVK